MKPLHFISVLIETYERAYATARRDGATEATRPFLELGVHAAAQVATNNWHGWGERAALIGASLLRTLYGDEAAAHAAEFPVAVRVSIAFAADPPLAA